MNYNGGVEEEEKTYYRGKISFWEPFFLSLIVFLLIDIVLLAFFLEGSDFSILGGLMKIYAYLQIPLFFSFLLVDVALSEGRRFNNQRLSKPVVVVKKNTCVFDLNPNEAEIPLADISSAIYSPSVKLPWCQHLPNEGNVTVEYVKNGKKKKKFRLPSVLEGEALVKSLEKEKAPCGK